MTKQSEIYPELQLHITSQIRSTVNHPIGGGGGDSVTIMPGCACRKVKEMGHFCASSVEVNEKISFKMGMKFAASVCKGKDFLHVWHIFVCKSTGGILQSVSR